MTDKLPPRTEAEILKNLSKSAKSLGFLVYHTVWSVSSDVGFPDLTIIGYGHRLTFEIKGPRGKVSERQERWIAECVRAGEIAMVVFPEDEKTAMDLIEAAYVHPRDRTEEEG